MKNKVLMTILAGVLGMLLCSGCACEHVYGAWTVEKNAICYQEGTEIRTCTKCEQQESRSLPMTAHTLADWNVQQVATCVAEGVEKRVCMDCPYSETRSLAMIEHTMGAWTVTSAATCVASGEESRSCSGCTKTEQRTLAALGHSYGEWTVVKQVTCSEAGVEESKCTLCGDTQQRTQESKGHDWKAASCTAPETCAVCGETRGESAGHADAKGDRICDACGYVFSSCPVLGTWSSNAAYINKRMVPLGTAPFSKGTAELTVNRDGTFSFRALKWNGITGEWKNPAVIENKDDTTYYYRMYVSGAEIGRFIYIDNHTGKEDSFGVYFDATGDNYSNTIFIVE